MFLEVHPALNTMDLGVLSVQSRGVELPGRVGEPHYLHGSPGPKACDSRFLLLISAPQGSEVVAFIISQEQTHQT